MMLQEQRQQQLCEMSYHNVSNAGAGPPVYPASHALSSRMHGNAAAHLSGRSPALVAMERVMPKYATPDDTSVVQWQLGRDRKNFVGGEYSSLVPTELASRCGRLAALPGHLSASAAGDVDAGMFGCMSGERQPTVNLSSSGAVTVPGDSASARSAKDQLRARLSHRPASSSSTLRHLSHLGNATFITFTSSLLSVCSQDFQLLLLLPHPFNGLFFPGQPG